MPATRRDTLRAGAAALPVLLLAACAVRRPAPKPAAGFWSGRLSLRFDADPPLAFSAAFELLGDPQTGELKLLSPLGQVLALVQWHPGDARLHAGGEVQQFDSLDALALALGGRLGPPRDGSANQDISGSPLVQTAALPLTALFAWLAGTGPSGAASTAAEWTLDDSRRGEGRLVARRINPSAELRLLLDQ